MTYLGTLSRFPTLSVLVVALLQLGSSAAWGQALAEGTDQAEADVKACKEHLNRIFEALEQYQREYNDLPKWFLDLHPEFTGNIETFICPVFQRHGDLRSWRAGLRRDVFFDPVLPTSYTYEFSGMEIPLAPGVTATYREYKLRQMDLVGDRVPIVRCFAHEPVLNLSIGGRVYPSGKYWEDELTNGNHEELEPRPLFQDRLMRFIEAPRFYPPRSADADTRLLDLSGHYNFQLDETSLPTGTGRGDFGGLPQGVVRLEGLPVSFDIRGRIQLKGKKLQIPFPTRAGGIRVDQPCRRLHFLCGTVDGTTNGTEVGSFEMAYVDGRSGLMQITYGKHVQHWLFEPRTPQTGDAQVAWLGAVEPTPARGKLARLYHVAWENPWPEVPIATLDFVSALTDAAPFLIAITVE